MSQVDLCERRYFPHLRGVFPHSGFLGAPPPPVNNPPHPTTGGPLKRTPLYEEHKKLGARLVPFAGWEMPVQYTGIVEEHRAVRTAAGLFDVSHMGELELRGEHAAAVVDYLVTNDARSSSTARRSTPARATSSGTILDDLIVYRVARDVFLIVCNAGNRDKISAHFRKAAENHCEFEDRSDETALIALQGPRAIEILGLAGRMPPPARSSRAFSSATRWSPTSAPPWRAPATPARTASRSFCASSDAPHLFRTLLELGKSRGLEPTGLGARDTLRLEARLALYGNDIDETTNPLEAGLGWVVKLDKPMFVGKDALVAISKRGLGASSSASR